MTVTLDETDSLGNTIATFTTTTGSDGSYTFSGLPNGTYTIERPQVSGYNPGSTFGGSVSGNFTDDQILANGNIADIVLVAGNVGNNFNFSEILAGSSEDGYPGFQWGRFPLAESRRGERKPTQAFRG